MKQPILIIDDESAIRELLTIILSEENYDVVTFDQFKTINEIIEVEACLIILDAKMPRISGIELSHTLKSHPRTCQVPILALSASNPKELEGMQCDAFLPKPFNVEDLLELVRNLCRSNVQELEPLAS